MLRNNRQLSPVRAPLSPEPGPPPSRLKALHQRISRLYPRFQIVFLIGAGILIALAAVYLYDATRPPPLEIIDEASSRGVRVFTVGLGSPEGTILRTQGYAIRVRLDEGTLKRIAERTGASYFKAETETDLSNIYENLSTRLVLKPEQTEITAGFTALAAVLLLIAGTLSLLWFNRLP